MQPGDYTQVTNGSKMLSGTVADADKKVTITLASDSEYEGDETFMVNFNAGTDVVFNGGATTLAVTVTITEDDAAPTPTPPSLPTITAAVKSGTTPSEANGAQIRFSLGSASHIDTVFYYTTSIATGGTADTASNSDLPIGRSENFTILKGATTYDLTIPAINDDIVEGNETFTFEFNVISGATGGGGSNAFQSNNR